MKKNLPKLAIVLYLSIFILIGFYFTIMGLFPVKIKIENINDMATAKVYRKSMMQPFKNIDLSVPNVKLVNITTSRTSKGGTTYRLEFENFKGERFPVTPYYSSGYSSKAKLQDEINSAIQNKSDFVHVEIQLFMIIFGLIFMLIPSFMMFAFMKKEPATSTLKKATIDPAGNTSPQKAEPEEEKYKKINDSIIK